MKRIPKDFDFVHYGEVVVHDYKLNGYSEHDSCTCEGDYRYLVKTIEYLLKVNAELKLNLDAHCSSCYDGDLPPIFDDGEESPF
jgi:hypothetical protein